jgi:hypothetical protein
MHIYPTPTDLTNWIANSHKGDRFQYHLGHLLHDRRFKVTQARTGGSTLIDNIPLGEIADAAVRAYEDGFVVLVQHKISEDLYQYLAIRTKKYVPAPLMEEVNG